MTWPDATRPGFWQRSPSRGKHPVPGPAPRDQPMSRREMRKEERERHITT